MRCAELTWLVLGSMSGIACAPELLLSPPVQLDENCEAKPGATPLAEPVLDLVETPARYLGDFPIDGEDDVTLETAEVFFERADGEALRTSQLASDAASAAVRRIAASVSTGIVRIPVIDERDAAFFADEEGMRTVASTSDRFDIVAHIKVVGARPNGSVVQSQVLKLPMRLCSGCLLQPNCGTFEQADWSAVCRPGQDDLPACVAQ